MCIDPARVEAEEVDVGPFAARPHTRKLTPHRGRDEAQKVRMITEAGLQQVLGVPAVRAGQPRLDGRVGSSFDYQPLSRADWAVEV